MPDENEQKKEHSRISLRIGEVQVELEGTYDNIKKLMGKELFDFTKGLQETKKQLPSSTEITPEVTPKAPEVTPKEKTVPPPRKPPTTSKALSQPSRVSAIGKTTEKKSRKKIVGKMMVIALGIICIVLVAGLVGAIAVYTPMIGNLESQIAEMENQIAERDGTISSLNSTVSSLKSQISSLAYLVANYSDYLNQSYNEIDLLNSQILAVNNILYLNESAPLVDDQTISRQDPNTNTTCWNDMLDFAGYVTVDVQSSSTTTYVQVVYSALGVGVDYDNIITVGTGGTAAFPVLPAWVEVRVGNTELVDNVNATVSALYVY